VTRYKRNRWLLRRVFRPVPGLGVSYVQFPMACAMGYFLSPFGLDVSEELQVSAWEIPGLRALPRAFANYGRGSARGLGWLQWKESQAGWRGLFSDHTERSTRRGGA
jgi:hypothetical protein